MAEVLVDALNAALGVPGEFGADAPEGARAIEIATNQVQSPDLARAFRVFGRPRRAGRPATANVPEARPAPDPVPHVRLRACSTSSRRGRLRTLLESDRCDAAIIDELFLATLSRFPTDDERDRTLDHLRTKTSRKAAYDGRALGADQYA